MPGFLSRFFVPKKGKYVTMVDMYVANCTKQVQEFMYRMPETRANRVQRIDMGRQIKISGDLTQGDVDAIVEQHAIYGMVRVDEIDRRKPFIGVCWDTKPISISKIESALNHNHSLLVAEGIKNRKEAAIALNDKLEQHAIQDNNRIKKNELEIIEEPDRAKTKSPTVFDNITIDRTANPDSVPSAKKRGRG